MLAQQKIPPTPENYLAYYNQIAGFTDTPLLPTAELKKIADAISYTTPEEERLVKVFEKAIESGRWSEVRQSVVHLCQTRLQLNHEWGALINSLLTQLERHTAGLTTAKKRDAIRYVLASSSNVSDRLYRRLQKLLESWDSLPAQLNESLIDEATTVSPETDLSSSEHSATSFSRPSFAPLLADLLLRGISKFIDNNPTLSAETKQLADELLEALSNTPPARFEERLELFISHLELAGETLQATHQALLNLLRLIIENISELVLDDKWLNGQLTILSQGVSGSPDIRTLDDIATRLRDIIGKQGKLKRDLTDAQHRLKTMLAGFVDRLSSFSTTTDNYHDALDRYTSQISAAQDISDLSGAVEEMLRQTRFVQETTLRSKEELTGLRHQVETANNRIALLQRELEETSELVRHDPLTGTLNRKGIDEVLARELAQIRRRNNVLCLTLLDVDNFKCLNDTYGHKAGDDALRYLSKIMRSALRPQDSIGRYGGEEFLILLPDTTPTQARQIIIRLQRELTRHLFMVDDQKLLITFSAGICALTAEGDIQQAIEQADKAMYAAKRAGKNRVFLTL